MDFTWALASTSRPSPPRPRGDPFAQREGTGGGGAGDDPGAGRAGHRDGEGGGAEEFLGRSNRG